MKKSQREKGRTTFRLFSFLAIFFAIVLFVPVFSALTIRDTETNQLVWSGQVKENSTFAIRWIHSIHRSPVVEYYHVRDGAVELTEMTFQDYGIGMSSELAPGEQLVTENGTFRIIHMNRSFPALHLFIGQVRANHTLLFEGEEIPLGTVDKPGSAVTIQVEKQSIFNWIGGF